MFFSDDSHVADDDIETPIDLLYPEITFNEEAPNVVNTSQCRKLFEHQIDAINFMKNNCIDSNSGCIVAHHMGLGKTLSTLAFLNSFKHKCPKVLILTKKSIVDQWISESKVKYDGSKLEVEEGLITGELKFFNFRDSIR